MANPYREKLSLGFCATRFLSISSRFSAIPVLLYLGGVPVFRADKIIGRREDAEAVAQLLVGRVPCRTGAALRAIRSKPLERMLQYGGRTQQVRPVSQCFRA